MVFSQTSAVLGSTPMLAAPVTTLLLFAAFAARATAFARSPVLAAPAAQLLSEALSSVQPSVRHRVSVSGQSAGGSMAVQHLFAFSSSVDGAAVAAGSPYG